MRKRLIPKYPRLNSDEGCEHESGPGMPGMAFKEQVWQSQLQHRQIILNEDVTDSIIEKAVIQIFNINDFDDDNEQNLAQFEIAEEKLQELRAPITIYINTTGGFMDEAFSLISAIESSKTPVYTCVLGKAWSAGFLIGLAGHQRFCQKYSSLMYHQGSAGINDTFGKMIEYAKYWESCQEMVEKYVAKRTKIKKKKLEEIFIHKKDWFVTPKEAVELGIVDSII
jgi:ATP-dependent Clp protease protease subunit